ncbi:hypothetical protein Tco_0465524 [Tanacetum coccineum]
MYDNPCKYRHEYPRSYFPQKDKGMTKPWEPLFNEGYKKNKTPRDQEITSRNLTPKEITDQFHQEDQSLNIKTYFSDFPQLQPSKPQPRDYSCEEWLRIKLGHTNVSKSVWNSVLNEWVLDSFDVEIDYGKTCDDPYSRRFDEYKKVFDKEIIQLANEYDLRIGKKGDSKKKSDERVLDDALLLGRANGPRLMGMIKKEMDEEGGSGGKEMEFKVTSTRNYVAKLLLKNMSIGARDAGFGRGKHAKEGSQGQLRRNHPAGVTL